MKHAQEHYFRILEQVALAGIDDDIESCLADAFEQGRSMVDHSVPPDEVTKIHHEAILRLAKLHPQLPLGQVADRLTRPLMEMSMAYGLAFREQTKRRYERKVNARLEQSRKLEAIGTLAAGIAHDFNNILGSIVGFAGRGDRGEKSCQRYQHRNRIQGDSALAGRQSSRCARPSLDQKEKIWPIYW